MSKIKIILYEDLAQESALRKKMRISRSTHFPEGYTAFRKEFCPQDIALEWQPRSEPWPSELVFQNFASDAPSSVSVFVISGGHIFKSSQLKSLGEALRIISRKAVAGLWSIQKELVKNLESGESFEHHCEIYNLNEKLQDFDFSFFASRPRVFNKILFNHNRVSKVCLRKDKGLAQLNFLLKIPPSLKDYFPTVLESEIGADSVTYIMPNQRLFDLGRMAVEGALDERAWQQIYSHLKKFFDLAPKADVSIVEYQARLKELFILKLEIRMREFLEFDGLKALQDQFQKLTGHSFDRRVQELKSELSAVIAKSTSRQLTFSHGDMSFSNILYDLDTERVCLLDPRGSSENDSPYRPIEYDLAKLSHSAMGTYEAICEELVVGEASMQLMKEQFILFSHVFKISLWALRLYEASLFWSLLPLHLDCPAQLLQFMLAGERAFVAALSDGNFISDLRRRQRSAHESN